MDEHSHDHDSDAVSVAVLGRILFGVAMAAFAVLCFAYADGVVGLAPTPSWLPPRAFGYLNGVVLLLAGSSLAFGLKARWPAMALALVLSAWLLLIQVPGLALALKDGGQWTTTFETLALCGAAWALAGAARLGRLAYAASLPVFAVLHLVYHEYVASVIPAWIPGHVFWTYATALAFVAAAVALASGLRDRLAALLLGAMFGSWVLMVHAPRVARAPRNSPEWTSLVIALAMCGGAWAVGGGPRREAAGQKA